MIINIAELKEIDKSIDAQIQSFPLLKYDRDIALYHTLFYYESFVTQHSVVKAGNIAGHNAIIKNAQDGIDFAFQWIHKHCLVSGKIPSFRPNIKIMKYAEELLDKSILYSDVWDSMTLLFRGICDAELEDENAISLKYKDGYKKEYDIINKFLNYTDDIDSIEKDLFSFLDLDPASLIASLKCSIKNNILEYTVPDSVYISCSRYNIEAKKHLFELDPNWDLGGYTVQKFRYFYNHLRTITTIHMMGCMFAHSKGNRIFNPFLSYSKEDWIKNILENIQITEEECKRILDDLTYNPDLYSPGKKIPDVTYQPFIPLGNKLILFNSLVQQSNYERNHWDLLSIIRNGLHSRLRNEKEELWLNNLSLLCKQIGLETYTRINFNHKNQSSDIDLVIMDNKNKVILLTELKWITSPDRVKDIVYLSDELKKGLKQMSLALEWATNTKEDFAAKIGFSGDINEYKIHGIVVSKNSMGNGFTYDSNIPIINERIFKWILVDPYKLNIRELYKIASERRFTPKPGIHYNETDQIREFGNYKFKHEGTSMILLRHFDPINDFDLTNL